MRSIGILSLLIVCINAEATFKPLKVLFFNPIIGVSHVTTLGAAADTLAKRGHKVISVVSMTDVRINVEPLFQSEKIYVPQGNATGAIMNTLADANVAELWRSDTADPASVIELALSGCRTFVHQCRVVLSNETLLERLRQEQFDYAIAEPFDLCGYVLFMRLGIRKFSSLQTMGLNEKMAGKLGLPAEIAHTPGLLSVFSDRMSFGERLKNWITWIVTDRISDFFVASFEELANEFVPGETLTSFMSHADFVFVHSEPLLDFPRSTTYRIVHIGGIVMKEGDEAALDEGWSSLLSLRPRTVLVSFGSVAQAHLMPDKYKNTLKEVFSRFPNTTFIWKYEHPGDGVAEGIDNLVVEKWLPQKQLLADPRLSAFVTHGGMGSTQEALIKGVPVVCMPVFGDQMRNCRVIERVGTGVFFEKNSLETPDALVAALERVLGGKSFATNARRYSKMLAAKPFTVKEKFVRSVEFSARFPLNRLNSVGARMPLYQYYLLDVAGFAISIVAGVAVLLYYTACALITTRKTKTD